MRLLACMVLAPALLAAPPPFPAAEDLDEAIGAAIDGGAIPGAVLMIGNRERVLYKKAYGARAVQPRREPMTEDTIFDAASLTKVVATTSCLMRLFEQGKVRLNDPVTTYLPDFQGGKSEITIRHLLTHFSGLRPDLDLAPEWQGYATGVQKALADKPVAPPGERFIYSDINYILLGEIVRRLSGQSLPDFAHDVVFGPLGMKDTRFQPPASLRPRIAPTERLPGAGAPLRGVVHDPTTRYMNGVAGHAGMFTTAADLARFAAMILGEGEFHGRRLFSPATIHKFTSPQTPPNQPVLRGLGWDMDSQYSSNRGELFPLGSFGHTGFTGTSLWIDPTSRTYVILLTNSVHPRIRPAISPLRSKVATVTAAALGINWPGVSLTGYNELAAGPGIRRETPRNGRVLTGLDVLARGGFLPLRGRRVGLITNHTGLDQAGRRNVDLMLEAGVNVVALYSPEHGITGQADREGIGHASDAQTGLPVWSLYLDDKRRPDEQMLRDTDVLVFDIQDAGARFYTYMCTMLYAMEEAARRKIPFLVLDRPNPITGVFVEGPMLSPDLESFVGCFPLPVRHGMTLGEIATMANAERGWGAELTVIRMEGWQRGDWFDSTGLTWVDPSPNLRSLNANLLYPGLALLEASPDYSVGRGTDSPFEQIGAPWIDGRQLAAYLNARRIPGVRVYPTRFRPAASKLEGEQVEGVRFVITSRDTFSSTRLGIELAGALLHLYPGRLDLKANTRLIGDVSLMQALEEMRDPRLLYESIDEAARDFAPRSQPYRLYGREAVAGR